MDGVYDGKFVLAEALSYADNGANVRVITPHYAGAKKKKKFMIVSPFIGFSISFQDHARS